MKSSDWISVEDRLPEADTMVLICTTNNKCGISSMYIPTDCYGKVLGDKEWRGSGAMKTAITHWQEIVLPKKEEFLKMERRPTLNKVLHLPLKKEWYQMIGSGVKTEEYREIKPYWIKRFFVYADGRRINNSDAKYLARNLGELFSAIYEGTIKYINYIRVKFSYGYTKRTMIYEIDSFTYGKGRADWGAPDENVFIIKLGERILEP